MASTIAMLNRLKRLQDAQTKLEDQKQQIFQRPISDIELANRLRYFCQQYDPSKPEPADQLVSDADLIARLIKFGCISTV